MNEHPRILIIGTGDTKADELLFMSARIQESGGIPVMMDVSILGAPPYKAAYDKHDIVAAAGVTLEDVTAGGDENSAMTLMARGAAILARRVYDEGRIDGFIALGGTMGTDFALDVALALPLGVPKFVVSTVAYSHLMPPDRIATDLMMILWAGGLYGLNSICQSVLAQASGAVVGAAKSAVLPQKTRPIIGMSSLGKSCLKYMVRLKPELEKRGYELVVFHTTGMGGRAMEAVAAHKGFAAVMDFSLQEVANHFNGSIVTSGPDRLENAGRMGIPQIVAPGAVDMVDLPAWRPVPHHLKDRTYYAHNRLIGMVIGDEENRREVAREIGRKLAKATGPTAFILPNKGIEQWDQEGEPFHDPSGTQAFVDEMRKSVAPPAELHEIDAHINDPLFVDTALRIFDRWVAEGLIPAGATDAEAAE